jgi:hypothetical protein
MRLTQRMNRQTTGWYNQQQNRVTTYKAPKHEIPTEWNCAGSCTEPVPDPPAGSVNESFLDRNAGSRSWIVYMSVAALVFTGITLLGRKR